MRHHRRTKRLVRTVGHRRSLLRNISLGVLRHQRIKTTKTKAKEAVKVIDRLITLTKTADLHSRRMAFDILRDRTEVLYLFTKIGPLFKNRMGGYTRIIPFGYRRGDGAELVLLELVEKLPGFDKPKEKKKKTAEKKTEKEVKPAAKPETAQTEQHKEKPHELPKEQIKKTPVKIIDRDREKAKSEHDKLQKGFLKGLRTMFRGKADRGS